MIPFFVAISNINSNAVFSGEALKTTLTIGPAQVEALTFTNGVFYASSEAFSNPPLNSASQMFTFSLDEDGDSSPNPGEESPSIQELIVYKTSKATELNYELNSNKPIFGMGIFDNQGRMVMYTPLERITQSPIDISFLTQGLYHLAFFYDNSAISSAFFRD